MPSAFAHALVGGAASHPLLPEERRSSLAVVFALLAALPDLDVLAFRFGIPYAHPLGHRGLTHSLVFAALVALLSFPVWVRVLPSAARLATGLTFFALASHGLLDTLTDAGLGVGLFVPLDDGRYFAPWRPIATSPLSVYAFFTERGLRVLRSEALWIGLPCAAYGVLVAAVRRLSSRSSARRSL